MTAESGCIAISRADRDERESRPHGVQKGIAAARLAAMVADLEHVRAQRVAVVRDEPILLGTLGVANE